MSKAYLRTFFEEKQLPFQAWEITADDGEIHFIDTDVVKETIFNAAAPAEIKTIADTIRRIDFANGDVNHFLKHLAKGMIEARAKSLAAEG